MWGTTLRLFLHGPWPSSLSHQPVISLPSLLLHSATLLSVTLTPDFPSGFWQFPVYLPSYYNWNKQTFKVTPIPVPGRCHQLLSREFEPLGLFHFFRVLNLANRFLSAVLIRFVELPFECGKNSVGDAKFSLTESPHRSA